MSIDAIVGLVVGYIVIASVVGRVVYNELDHELGPGAFLAGALWPLTVLWLILTIGFQGTDM